MGGGDRVLRGWGGVIGGGDRGDDRVLREG